MTAFTRPAIRILFTVFVLLSATLYAQSDPPIGASDTTDTILSSDQKVQILELKNAMLGAEARFAQIQIKLGQCEQDTIAALNREVADLQKGYQMQEKQLLALKTAIERENPGHSLNMVTLKLIKTQASAQSASSTTGKPSGE